MDAALLQQIAGQIAGFVALALCLVAFASRNDERLLAVLVFGNLAFVLQYALLEAWVAAAISVLVWVRTVLARRLQGSRPAMVVMLAAAFLVAALTWQGPMDVFPLAAGIFGTVSMFLLRGIPLRIGLAATALCWVITDIAIAAIGALLADLLVFVTNLLTIARMAREGRRT